jgi:site-specific DNA-methyltransferase (adenine-specific)
MNFPTEKYQIIYADPPWFFSGGVYQDSGRPARKVSDKYRLAKTASLIDLSVSSILGTDAIIFMWTTDQHIPDALKLMEAWGFRYCTVAFYWVKKYASGANCCNVGCWTMKGVEQCLLGLHGKPMRFKKSRNVRQLVEAERTTHSKKPDEVRNRIVELCGDLPRVELFARQETVGWDALGNEIDGMDMQASLELLGEYFRSLE